MTRLAEALQALGLEGEVDLAGRWVKVGEDRCPVYVYEAARGGGYYAWCGCPEARTVQFYRDATEAIQAGLHRAAGRTTVEAMDAAAMEGVVSSQKQPAK